MLINKDNNEKVYFKSLQEISKHLKVPYFQVKCITNKYYYPCNDLKYYEYDKYPKENLKFTTEELYNKYQIIDSDRERTRSSMFFNISINKIY
jgi:hypothetical protein